MVDCLVVLNGVRGGPTEGGGGGEADDVCSDDDWAGASGRGRHYLTGALDGPEGPETADVGGR